MTSNKSSFFHQLEELDQVSDDAEANAADFPTLLRALSSPASSTKPSAQKEPHPALARASTVPEAPDTRIKDKKERCSKASNDNPNKDETLNENKMKRPTGASNSGIDKTLKKRRTASLKIIPESKQIFKGLTFFFIPNNGVAPARRLRIQRSQEYGAVWAQLWSTDVTHIIVDKGLNFEEIYKVLSPDQLSHNPAIVNQDYPSECLRFGRLLSVTQSRFRVDGIPRKEPKDDSPVTPTEKPSSLPIKGPRRHIRRLPTPSQVEDLPTAAVVQADNVTANFPESASNHDMLDDIMKEVKSMNDLPLDENDDEGIVYSVSSMHTSDNEEAASVVDVPDWQKNFSCMQQCDGAIATDNPNARTIEILQKMGDYYSKTADNWRTIAYRKAIAALRKQTTKISTRAEALAIPGIGSRLADKIEEIVTTDRLRRLENTDVTPEDRALQLFLGVYGAGFAQATKWIAKGYRSLEDLKTKASLTTNQQIGVDRYYDFQQRIPRDEVAMHGKIVRDAVHAVDPGMDVIIAGSYRRGAEDCGDIDLLVTKPKGTLESIRALMLDRVVPRLIEQGFLKTSLAVTSRVDGAKWHGASALPDKDVWRRIDLLFVPGDEIGAALLYFTGNDIFNRSMRLLARKKGLCLNQRGLYKDILRGPGQVKTTNGSLMEGRDEKRIFAILGVPWRPPGHRVC